MKSAILFAFLLCPNLVFAVICKTVDADGVVGYTDVPVGECKQRVELPEYSRYTPRPVQQTAPPTGSVAGTTVKFERYESMAITQPENNGTVRSNDGKVPVSIALQPALQTGHKIAVYLDAMQVNGTFAGPSIELSGVDRGTHTLRAAVLDVTGKTLIEAATVRFTLRKIGLNDPANKPDEKPTPLPNNYKPPAAPDYSPPAGGNGYKPSATGISSTPGKTNPSFAPRYTP